MAGIITALTVQVRNKKRVNVYIDGEFAFGLAAIEAVRLNKGQYLSEDQIALLRGQDEIEVVHEAALDILSYRPRSAAEMKSKLTKRGFSQSTIEVVIDRLKKADLLDDKAFALYWIENRQQFGPRSVRALRYELRKKGVSDTIISSVVTGLDEEEAAYQAATDHTRCRTDKDKKIFSKRLGDFLIRRGFGYGTVRRVVDRLWQEYHDGDSSHDTLNDLGD
jgi:regulatory protein